MFRAISELPSPSQRIPGYATSDVRVGRSLAGQITLALVGQNLHEPHHAEFVSGGPVSEAQRSVYGSVIWRW
jgi:hypothetical protein